MATDSEPAIVRWAVSVPAAAADETLALLLDAFPAGLEEERDGAHVILAGYLGVGIDPQLPAGLAASRTLVAPGWREAWRSFHRPVTVGGHWIGPPWIAPDPGADAIVIEPGLAFGTGAHGSTRAAAELLSGLAPGPITDLGCGSGVLAILAARRGFAPVLALDRDPHAVAAARVNATRNGVVVDAWQADVLVDRLPATPLVVANLQLDLLEPLFQRADLAPHVIASGLLTGERFEPAGWVCERTCERDGWRALDLQRAGS